MAHLGLTAEEVEARRKDGRVNKETAAKTKSVHRILFDNIFSLFNLINVLLAASLIWVGAYKNMLFMGIVICNTAIGIIQEIRSKIVVDRLSIVVAQKAQAIRDGQTVSIALDDIVLDDCIVLERGNQIPADCRILEGECFVNESLLTGESDLIQRRTGDQLLSGSFIASGKCIAKVFHVGADNYAASLSAQAKYLKKGQF